MKILHYHMARVAVAQSMLCVHPAWPSASFTLPSQPLKHLYFWAQLREVMESDMQWQGWT